MGSKTARKKVLLVFGTRPEAIKMCPLVKELEKSEDDFDVKVCVTAQHREMLDQVLKLFEVKPDYDLDVMRPDQDLYQITSNVILGMKRVLSDCNPDFVLVHGDTTSTFTAALAAFYQKIPVGHVEAGLRTGDIYSPWPEEINRCLTSQIATYHFAPTELSKRNLLSENRNEKHIAVTGNTVIDSLFFILEKITTNNGLEFEVKSGIIKSLAKLSIDHSKLLSKKRRIVLITGHRRENFGKGFLNICEALKSLAATNKGVDFIYPVHLNPNVQKPVYDMLSDLANVFLIEPLGYEAFVYLMNLSHLILTDSGGVQEEAPSLGKPVLVMRDTTERPEAVEAGTVKVVGTNIEKICLETNTLLHDPREYEKMSKSHNPYGDGKACARIINFLKGV
jgi:UDP-N-acetylglucosamine 2-epimerase (non-hydrolysing)